MTNLTLCDPFVRAGHKCVVVERVHSDKVTARKKRESFWMSKLQTLTPDGLSTQGKKILGTDGGLFWTVCVCVDTCISSAVVHGFVSGDRLCCVMSAAFSSSPHPHPHLTMYM